MKTKPRPMSRGFISLELRSSHKAITQPGLLKDPGCVPDSAQICHMGDGAPGGIRTPDQWLRKPLLYPAELQARFQRTFSCQYSFRRALAL